MINTLDRLISRDLANNWAIRKNRSSVYWTRQKMDPYQFQDQRLTGNATY